jgi:hypothetical protein
VIYAIFNQDNVCYVAICVELRSVSVAPEAERPLSRRTGRFARVLTKYHRRHLFKVRRAQAADSEVRAAIPSRRTGRMDLLNAAGAWSLSGLPFGEVVVLVPLESGGGLLGRGRPRPDTSMQDR